MSKNEIDDSLDAIITKGVEAKIDAAVMQALSGDEVFANYVTAALSQKVEIKTNNSYRTREVSFLHHTVTKAIQNAVQDAVVEALAEDTLRIQEVVRKKVKASSDHIAEQFARNLADKAGNAYGFRLEMKWPGEEIF